MQESGSAEVEKNPAKQTQWVQEHQPCSLQLHLRNEGENSNIKIYWPLLFVLRGDADCVISLPHFVTCLDSSSPGNIIKGYRWPEMNLWIGIPGFLSVQALNLHCVAEAYSSVRPVSPAGQSSLLWRWGRIQHPWLRGRGNMVTTLQAQLEGYRTKKPEYIHKNKTILSFKK